jgi:tRNA pseudouridine38-40 synthase
MEQALRKLGWRGRAILAAGRTDAGVHAAGQVVAFELDWRRSRPDLQRSLNSLLPPDVVVRTVDEAPPGFHPRFDARARLYRYRIRPAAIGDPFQDRFAWRLWPPPDGELLGALARRLPGTRDFGGFGRDPGPSGNTIRTVMVAEWAVGAAETVWVFTIEADAFLFHMVRRLVAAMVRVAQGIRSPEDFAGALVSPRRHRWTGGLAPARGLSLDRVRYDQTTRVASNGGSERG